MADFQQLESLFLVKCGKNRCSRNRLRLFFVAVQLLKTNCLQQNWPFNQKSNQKLKISIEDVQFLN